MDEEQDQELQMALALSLQEYQHTQSPLDAAGPSNNQTPQSTADNNLPSPRTVAGKNPASGSGAAAKPTQRRGKKLPQFAPTEAEIAACFQELVSNGRSHATIVDIMETGTKLGLELDLQKVRTMIEYLGDNRVGSNLVRTGAISLQDFRQITQHFRVE